MEDLEGYHVGGYHPVYLQDEYSDGRYRIVHKPGFGTYSTVWLAKDQHMNRYVAVKIVVADASNTSSETQILRHLVIPNQIIREKAMSVPYSMSSASTVQTAVICV